MASFFDDECVASGDYDDDDNDDESVGSAGSLRDFIAPTDDEDEDEDEEEVISPRDHKKRRRCKEESNSAAVVPRPPVARAAEDGAASERRRKKIVAERARRARNKAAAIAGDVGALEKKRKKNEADRQRCRDVITAACAGDSPAVEKQKNKNEADRRRRSDLKTAACAGDSAAIEKQKNKNEADRQREQEKRKHVTAAAAKGNATALEFHRKDRKRKAVQRTSRNLDSVHVAGIFQRYRQGEDLTATDRADYEASDEPPEWKMVVSLSPYMGGRTLAKDNFYFDRFPSAVTPAIAVCPQLRHVRDGLTVAEASASFAYDYYLQLHQKTSIVVFSDAERRHPVNHWEQISQCQFCGAHRAHVVPRALCCHSGTFVANETLPLEEEQIELARANVSKASRALNNVHAFAAFCLPRGQSRIPDDTQSMRVTGQCWRKIKHVTELGFTDPSATFFEDPEDSLENLKMQGTSRATMPRLSHIHLYDSLLRRCSPFAQAFEDFGAMPIMRITTDNVVSVLDDGTRRYDVGRALARDAEQHAFVAVERAGTTSSLRAFTTRPPGAVAGPRRVLFSTGNERQTRITATDPLYLPLRYPSLWPLGNVVDPTSIYEYSCRNITRMGAAKKLSINNVTMALMMQPGVTGWSPESDEVADALSYRRREPRGTQAEYLTLPVSFPANALSFLEGSPPRRFSLLQMFGRLQDEFVIDRHQANMDNCLAFFAHKQQRLTGFLPANSSDSAITGDADGHNGDAAATRTIIPASFSGCPRDMRQRIANALTAERKLGPPLLWMTMTTSVAWPEITTALPIFSNGDRQCHWDRCETLAFAFKGKLDAFIARLRNGTIFRNFGRPTETTRVSDDGTTTIEFVFPMQSTGGGYIIYSIEYQSRALVHVHVAYRPAKMPPQLADADASRGAVPGTAMPWVDGLVSGRVPSFEVLCDFGMLAPAETFLNVDFIRASRGQINLSYLRDPTKSIDLRINGVDTPHFVHPDIVHDFRICEPSALLNELQDLVSGETPAPGQPHWSRLYHARALGGTQVHSHPNGLDKPSCWCRTRKDGKVVDYCLKNFPKPTATYTKMGDDNRIWLKRAEDDVMIVPWNAWFMLYFRTHHCFEICVNNLLFSYMFKYQFKGNAMNRTTLRKPLNDHDEIDVWNTTRETMATESCWRSSHLQNFHQEPVPLVVHAHDTRDTYRQANDVGFSIFENYLNRPLFQSTRSARFDDWYSDWDVQPSDGAVATKSPVDAVTVDDALLKHQGLVRADVLGEVAHLQPGSPLWPQLLRDGRVAFFRVLRDVRDGRSYSFKYRYIRRLRRDDPAIARIVQAPIGTIAWYLRLLVTSIPAFASANFSGFEHFRRHVDDDDLEMALANPVYSSYEEACIARKILVTGDEPRLAIVEAIATFHAAPETIRSLLVMCLLQGYTAAASLLKSTEHITLIAEEPYTILDYMALDFREKGHTPAEARNAVFTDLHDRFAANGKDYVAFVGHDPLLQPRAIRRELERERIRYDPAEQRRRGDAIRLDPFNDSQEQNCVRNWVFGASDVGGVPATSFQPPTKLEVAFCDGKAGCGKTTTITKIAHDLRAENILIMLTAATALAATLYEDGWTTHSAAKIPVRADTHDNYEIAFPPEGTMTQQREEFLMAVRVFVVDEAMSLARCYIECFIRYLYHKQATCRVVLVGDPLQLIPVVPNVRDPTLIMESSFVFSPYFAHCFRLRLCRSIRTAEDPEWDAMLQQLSRGLLPATVDDTRNNAAAGITVVAVPIVTNIFRADHDGPALDDALTWVFGPHCEDLVDADTNRANVIMCNRHSRRRWYNDKVAARRAARSNARKQTYVATHKLQIPEGDDVPLDDTCPFDEGNLQELVCDDDGGIPDGTMSFYVKDVVILAVSLDRKAGLVKNCRAEIVHLARHTIQVKLASGKIFPIPRVIFKFQPRGVYGSHIVVRRQFPLIPAYALTSHRGQGQTFWRALYDARDPFFAHGQANVCFSRVGSRTRFGVVADRTCVNGDGHLLIVNTVYTALLDRVDAPPNSLAA